MKRIDLLNAKEHRNWRSRLRRQMLNNRWCPLCLNNGWTHLKHGCRFMCICVSRMDLKTWDAAKENAEKGLRK